MAELGRMPDHGLRSVRVQAAALVLAVLGLLAVGVFAARQVAASIDQLILDTARARLLANATQEVLSDLQNAETGQRGYLLTQRTVYLEPYREGVSRIDGALARLAGLASGLASPPLQADVAELTGAAKLKMAELAETIRLGEAQQIEAALALVLNETGKAYMDTARAVGGRIVARAEAERSQRSRTLQKRQNRVSDIMLAALGAGLVLLGITALTLLWNRARLLRAQQRERVEAARLEAAVEHVRDGVAVFDAESRLTLHNSRFAGALGLLSDAEPGTRLAELADAVVLDPPFSAGPGPLTGPVVTEVKQSGRTLEIWRSAMPDGGQMVAVADITRRVEAEAIARQAQKMEVLGQMTGGIAHDFNNLLQVVSANLELAVGRLSQTGAGPGVMDRLAAAAAGVARGARLTRHLLAFARRQPLVPEALEPGRLLTGMEDTLRRTLGESIDLELIVGGGLWTMRADPVQMESAILNLALNGRDAMGTADGLPSGRLTIEVANASLDESYTSSREEVTPGQYLMFAVTDNGAGMTPEQLARATEPFYTTKPDGKGTGLGLPMVFGFAKQSGGHFQLYSEPGRGTTARLYIPRTSLQVAGSEPVHRQPEDGGGALVLLVEDNPAVRLAAVASVRSLGYSVQEADSAEAAMALLKSGTRPALLFTDVVMPGKLTSREMADQARAMLPGLAVLFTSGYTQNTIVHNGQLDPGVNLISKPWRTADLGMAMQSALDAARAATPAATPLRVLLVEDEPLVRMTTADALMTMGFDVIEAGTARAALRKVQSAPDLLVADLGLPDMDGRQLVREIRALLPNLPVVVASGSSDRTGEEAVVWLSKPYDARQLRAAIDRALATAAG